MTDNQLETLCHAIGMTTKNYRKSLEWWLDDDNHRNHFCLPVNSAADGWADVMNLVVMGFMTEGRTINGGRDCYYHVTEAGIVFARESFARETATP